MWIYDFCAFCTFYLYPLIVTVIEIEIYVLIYGVSPFHFPSHHLMNTYSVFVFSVISYLLISSFSVLVSVSFSLFFQSLSIISFVSPLGVTVYIYNPLLHHHCHLVSSSYPSSSLFSSISPLPPC